MHSREQVFRAAYETVKSLEQQAHDLGVSPSHETVAYGRSSVTLLLNKLGYTQREFLTWAATQVLMAHATDDINHILELEDDK